MDEQEYVNRQCPYPEYLDVVTISLAATRKSFPWPRCSTATLSMPAVPEIAVGTRQYLTAQHWRLNEFIHHRSVKIPWNAFCALLWGMPWVPYCEEEAKCIHWAKAVRLLHVFGFRNTGMRYLKARQKSPDPGYWETSYNSSNPTIEKSGENDSANYLPHICNTIRHYVSWGKAYFKRHWSLDFPILLKLISQ